MDTLYIHIYIYMCTFLARNSHAHYGVDTLYFEACLAFAHADLISLLLYHLFTICSLCILQIVVLIYLLSSVSSEAAEAIVERNFHLILFSLLSECDEESGWSCRDVSVRARGKRFVKGKPNSFCRHRRCIWATHHWLHKRGPFQWGHEKINILTAADIPKEV